MEDRIHLNVCSQIDIDWQERFDESKEIELRALRAASDSSRIRLALNHMTMLQTLDVRVSANQEREIKIIEIRSAKNDVLNV